MSRTTNNRRKKRNRQAERRKHCWLYRGKVVPGSGRRPVFQPTDTFINSPAMKLLIEELEALPPMPPAVREAYAFFMKAFAERPSLADFIRTKRPKPEPIADHTDCIRYAVQPTPPRKD